MKSDTLNGTIMLATVVRRRCSVVAQRLPSGCPVVAPCLPRGSLVSAGPDRIPRGMKTADLTPLFQSPGPFATVLVDVGHDTANGAHEHELRVRAACDDLREQGADE